jgi:outer membrane protein TolC
MPNQCHSQVFRLARTFSIFSGLLFSWLSGANLAVAQIDGPNPSSALALTLRDCTRLALAQSPRLKSVAQDQIVSREAVGEVKGAYYPTLGVRGGASRWQSHAFLPSGLSNPDISSIIGPTDDWSAGGFARYMLYDSGVRRAALESAKARQSAMVQEGESTRLDVIFDVHQTFYQLAVALALRSVAGNNLTNVEAHLGVAQNRIAAGDTTPADVLRAQVEVDNAKAELIRTESLIRIAKGDLNTVMGLSAETPFEIDVSDAAQAADVEMSFSALLEKAVKSRPEIKAAQSAVTIAQQQVQVAKGAFGPKVYADGSYGWRDDSASLGDEVWSAGITVEVAAFEGFSNQHKLARTRAELTQAETALEQVHLAIHKDVWAAYARVREAQELVLATRTQVRDAEENMRLMAARYKAGAVTVTDLLDAQTALTTAEARQVQSHWGCQLARSALLRATGSWIVEK